MLTVAGSSSASSGSWYNYQLGSVIVGVPGDFEPSSSLNMMFYPLIAWGNDQFGLASQPDQYNGTQPWNTLNGTPNAYGIQLTDSLAIPYPPINWVGTADPNQIRIALAPFRSAPSANYSPPTVQTVFMGPGFSGGVDASHIMNTAPSFWSNKVNGVLRGCYYYRDATLSNPIGLATVIETIASPNGLYQYVFFEMDQAQLEASNQNTSNLILAATGGLDPNAATGIISWYTYDLI
tara:strand:+ start:1942 stop:2649 length:708 start_codon:yes stop_codon:yes gene_type:complete